MTIPAAQPELIAQKLSQLAHAKALRDTKWDACNQIGQHLIQHRIDQLCHDLHRLGADDQAQEVLAL